MAFRLPSALREQQFSPIDNLPALRQALPRRRNGDPPLYVRIMAQLPEQIGDGD